MDVLEKKEKPKEEKPVVAQPEPKLTDLECSPDAKPMGSDCRWGADGLGLPFSNCR